MLNRSISLFSASHIYTYFLVFYFLSFSDQVNATPLGTVQDLAAKLKLGNHPVWLKLLHYEKGADSSVVRTNNFFLSPNGRRNPDQELVATIDAYYKSFRAQDKHHARCRFPARYYWLSQYLPLPGYNPKDIQCAGIKSWGVLDSVESVSLLLVSGYLGNPASTFGHTFLKLNNEKMGAQSDLFDASLNYGAVVPEDENPFSYVINGVFGGYEAGFSDKYFYTQDLVYSHTEFRDIWEYRIDLSETQLKLLLLHIWEIEGHKFTYYFLDRNCAYRLGELIDLVLEEDLMNNRQSFYFPVDLFHKIYDIDQQRVQSGKKKIIKDVTYVPSSQRKLYSRLEMLSDRELSFFNAIVQEGISSMSGYLEQLPEERQIFLLDCLIAYQHYRIVSEQPEFNKENHEIKKHLLLARLQRPIREETVVQIPEIDSPAAGSRPMELGIGYSYNNNNHSIRLNWSLYKRGRVGKNSLKGNELILTDLSVGIDERHLYIDRFDLLSLLNLNTESAQLDHENRLSWELRIGVDRIPNDDDDQYNGVFSFGVGRAMKLWKDLIGYGMIPITFNTISDPVRLRPHLGLRYSIGNLSAWVFGGVESTGSEYDPHSIWGGKLHYQFSERYALFSEISSEPDGKISIGLSRYW